MSDRGEAVSFIHKDGRIIPIHASAGGGRTSAPAVKKPSISVPEKHGVDSKGHEKIKVNKMFNALGLGISIGTGALAAASFSRGAKTAIAGHVLAHAIDVGGVAANVASVKGKGHVKERAVQAAKQEVRNLVVGNAVYAAGILGTKAGRTAAVGYAKTGAAHLKNVMNLARKAFGVI